MNPSPFEGIPELPPEIIFVSLPKAMAQFHHLPLHVPVWIHRQEAVLKNGYDFQEGVGVMEELLKAVPGVPGAYLYQLFVRKWPKLMEVNPFFESGRIAEAIQKLISILEIDPECPLTCFQLGYCFRVTGELEKSESFYRNALRMAPDAGWIHSNLGRTYQAMGKNAQAAETFWKALELLPEDHFVLERLMALGELFPLPQETEEKGISFVKRSDYVKKITEFLGREKEPTKLIQMGWSLLRDGLNDLAQECFEKALREKKARPEALLGLGKAHLEAGRFKEAEKILTEYLDENPDSAPGHLDLFRVYLAQEEMDLAWEEIQSAIRLDPDNSNALRLFYGFFRETGRQEEGQDWMDRLSSENPQSFAPLLVKAQALAEGDQWPQAEKILKELLLRIPENEEALLFYTSELGKRGRPQDVLGLLETDASCLPFSLVINLALAFQQLKRPKEGVGVLKGFLKRPGVPPMEAERARKLLQDLGGKE